MPSVASKTGHTFLKIRINESWKSSSNPTLTSHRSTAHQLLIPACMIRREKRLRGRTQTSALTMTRSKSLLHILSIYLKGNHQARIPQESLDQTSRLTDKDKARNGILKPSSPSELHSPWRRRKIRK